MINSTACSTRSFRTVKPSRTPSALPGRLTISVFLRTPASPRESAARGKFGKALIRSASAIPRASLSRMARVASGVTSRSVRLVPQVVSIKSARLPSAHSLRMEAVRPVSSGTRRARPESVAAFLGPAHDQIAGAIGPLAAAAGVGDRENGQSERHTRQYGLLARQEHDPTIIRGLEKLKSLGDSLSRGFCRKQDQRAPFFPLSRPFPDPYLIPICRLSRHGKHCLGDTDRCRPSSEIIFL